MSKKASNQVSKNELIQNEADQDDKPEVNDKHQDGDRGHQENNKGDNPTEAVKSSEKPLISASQTLEHGEPCQDNTEDVMEVSDNKTENVSEDKITSNDDDDENDNKDDNNNDINENKKVVRVDETDPTDGKVDEGKDDKEDDAVDDTMGMEKPSITEEQLEDEWKKLTEDPNYPSLDTVDDLTSRKTATNPVTSDTPFDNTQVASYPTTTNYQPQDDAVPSLNFIQSSRLTQIPTYTSKRSHTEMAHTTTPFTASTNRVSHLSTDRFPAKRRQSYPRPQISSKQPYHHREDFLDDNMLISSTKLDGLLFRIFSKPKYNDHNTIFPINNSLNKNPDDMDIKQSSLPIFENSGSDIISMDPVIWQIHPMRATQKETLKSEQSFLEDNLDPKEIIKKLFMDGILTHLDYNQLTRTEGQGDRAVIRLLVGTLQRRGEKAYPAFIRALKDLDYHRISGKLEATELELVQGVQEDREDLERRTKMSNHFGSPDTKQPLTPGYHPSSERSNPVSADPKDIINPEPLTPTDQNKNLETNREEYNRQVEQQLTELNADLKALHEDVNTLRTARNNAEKQRVENSQPSVQKSSSCVIL